jgi:hypothetical protein
MKNIMNSFLYRNIIITNLLVSVSFHYLSYEVTIQLNKINLQNHSQLLSAVSVASCILQFNFGLLHLELAR